MPEAPTPSIELSVVVPCFNEEGNLDVLVDRMRRVFATHAIAAELILVNDGSRDGTGPAIDALAARHPGEIVAVHHRTNRGITAGWRSGLENARGRWVCTIDADLQYRPEDIASLFAIAREGTVDLITVLVTQQALFPAQDNQVEVRLARLQAVLSLFQALGGSWMPPAQKGAINAK